MIFSKNDILSNIVLPLNILGLEMSLTIRPIGKIKFDLVLCSPRFNFR